MACRAPGKKGNSASSARKFDNIVTTQRALTECRRCGLILEPQRCRARRAANLA